MPDIDSNYEPLPGYRLIERIGAGGYGEVWRAEAPGGLTKAIKFVFGKHDERRASNELRALERVRDVRHPFLLSLERIEVVDGRLVVVMELASGSIKDRFEACRRAGQPGIPREELLAYLRDAADALDFMSDQYSLQHLDIKPENLLVLADHVKVADFGLVKDVQQREASLVGGMTPLYAAPEVFQGAPTRCSDQYSLAIVYQDMLTGTLPFAGRSAAELTLQHLHDEPNLSSLTAADRYVVARALAKDPRHRYATCREFVEALARSATTGSGPFDQAWDETSASPVGAAETAARQSSQTEWFEEPCSRGTGNLAPQRFTLPAASGTVTDLPPIDVEQQDCELLPTVFLGVGGIAGRVLSHLRRKLYDRYGTAIVPAMPILWLDTNTAELAAANERAVGRLFLEETLAVPLGRPSHYRDRTQELLRWLSRRWLYNIPRSLHTEGLRPLGRLALADHARQAGQRIRRAVMDAVDPEAIRYSRQAVRRAFRAGEVQVYVLASISGGTGSGMAIDVGYLVRAVLDALELPYCQVTGLMMHATGRDPNHSELARVNAYSWLTEFHHFLQPTSAYINDGSCCLPSHGPDVPPFDQTYLVHLGDNLDVHTLDDSAESVAEYLELATLTPARPFFDACRRPSADAPRDGVQDRTPTLRSFGIFRRPAIDAEVCDELAAAVSRRVVMGWRGTSNARPPEETAVASQPADTVAADGARLVERLHLEPAAITALADALLEAELGTDAATFVASRLASGGRRPSDRLAAVDELFGGGEAASDGNGHTTLQGRPVIDIVRPLAEKLRSEIRRWVIQRVETPEQRLCGARRGNAWLRRYLEAADEHVQLLRRSAAAQLLMLRNSALGTRRPLAAGGKTTDEDYALHYFQLRLHQLALLGARHMMAQLLSELRALADELAELEQRLGQFQASLAEPAEGVGSDVPPTEPVVEHETLPDRVASVPEEKLRELSVEVDRLLQTEHLSKQGGLFATVMQGGRDRARLYATLHEHARRAVQRASASVPAVGTDGGTGAEGVLSAGLQSATPPLLGHGGTRRVLMVVPHDAAGQIAAADAARMAGADASLVAGLDNNWILCVEADELSLPHVAAEIIDYRQDRRALADRIHSRNDVAWRPLVASDAASGDKPAAGGLAAVPADVVPVPDTARQTEMI